LLRSIGVPEERILAGDPAWRGAETKVRGRTAAEGRDL
jgi:hypothetical protein